MKKVVAIIGSLRKESVNRAIFNNYREYASNKFEIIEGNLSDIPLYNEDVKEPEGVTELARLIRGSEGLLFFSPEYNYSVPGLLKNAIDWVSRNKHEPFAGKPTAIIGASPGNVGTARMQYELRKIGVFLNLAMINKPEVLISNAYDKIDDGKITHQETVDYLKNHVNAFNAYIEARG